MKLVILALLVLTACDRPKPPPKVHYEVIIGARIAVCQHRTASALTNCTLYSNEGFPMGEGPNIHNPTNYLVVEEQK